METTTKTGEGLFLPEEEHTSDPNNSIDTDRLPSTLTETSEELEEEQLMLMRNRNQPRILKSPQIPNETGSYTLVGWQTKTNSPRIICHGFYVNNDQILP